VRFLSLEEVVQLHDRVVEESGGSAGLRDRGALESSIRQPLQSFAGEDLYPSIVEKAAALGYFLIANHPFVDGNKRIGHAALEVTLVLNGFELDVSVDDQEQIILGVASGNVTREELTAWLQQHVVETLSNST
jgi:death-on-curing protein